MNWADKVKDDQAAAERMFPGCLEASGFKVYSQSDEDGIIHEIFKRIGTTNKTFVEFGAEVGQENNCHLLLESGWNGLWIEGEPTYKSALTWSFRNELAEGRLKFIDSYVNIENINRFITSADISGEIDLLSIDIDGNDAHVWNAIDCINPRVVVAEHNYMAPPIDYIMPYDPDFRWVPPNPNYGSSFMANVKLAESKGYSLVATGLYSPNGFYVRNDILNDRIRKVSNPANRYRELNYEAVINFPRTEIEQIS